MIENYEKLFAAIYEVAVRDDFETICGRAAMELVMKGVDVLESKRYIEQKREYIKRRVQENVYREAMEWGSGRSKEIQKENINALVAEVVDGYEKEVSETDKKATGRKRKVANKS